jgi:hypothetical protein
VADTSSRADTTAEADLLDTNAFEAATTHGGCGVPRCPSRDPDAAMPADHHIR